MLLVSVLSKLFLALTFNICIYVSSSECIAKFHLVFKHSLVLVFLMLFQDTYHYRCQNVKCFLASILHLLSLNFIENLLLVILRARRNKKKNPGTAL